PCSGQVRAAKDGGGLRKGPRPPISSHRAAVENSQTARASLALCQSGSSRGALDHLGHTLGDLRIRVLLDAARLERFGELQSGDAPQLSDDRLAVVRGDRDAAACLVEQPFGCTCVTKMENRTTRPQVLEQL